MSRRTSDNAGFNNNNESVKTTRKRSKEAPHRTARCTSGNFASFLYFR